METKYIQIPVDVLSGIEELDVEEQNLVNAAIAAAGKAYAPYSGFSVGAVALLQNGVVVSGNNQENAAYPSGMCAERVVLYWAGANYPDIPVSCLVIVATKNGQLTNDIVSPCGACRQVFSETEQRYHKGFKLILVGKSQVLRFANATDLLPLSFGPAQLK
jgi:cytidine deaminase